MHATPYDAIANEYYDNVHKTCRNFDATTVAALAGIRSNLPSGKVLEVGAGRGRANEFLGIEPQRVVQLDNSEAMLRLKPREDSFLRVLNDAESLPFPDGEFDLVLGFLCDPFLGLNFLSEARRVLRPGGMLVATTPSETWGKALRGGIGVDGMETRFVLRDGSTVKVPSALYPVAQLRSMLEAAGFKGESIEINSHHLPHSAEPVSDDVIAPAKQLGVSPHDLVLLDLIEARA
ncbi:class I SAM-dependent methyltransferase [Microbacterium sp. NPDC076895]|uniref:class I SAM-dependent methyltransferase n=1 Tax=Microbacterium sp. NPDC076895 TaxID=3154957 RepID=UPI00344202DA